MNPRGSCVIIVPACLVKPDSPKVIPGTKRTYDQTKTENADQEYFEDADEFISNSKIKKKMAKNHKSYKSLFESMEQKLVNNSSFK